MVRVRRKKRNKLHRAGWDKCMEELNKWTI